jgi:enolase
MAWASTAASSQASSTSYSAPIPAAASLSVAGYKPGEDITPVMDPATSEFFHDGVYDYTGEGRTAKYNQLIRIEEELGTQARYAGRDALGLRR